MISQKLGRKNLGRKHCWSKKILFIIASSRSLKFSKIFFWTQSMEKLEKVTFPCWSTFIFFYNCQRWNIARAPRACSRKKFGILRKDLWKSSYINWRNVDKCSKCLTMCIVRIKKLRLFCGRNADNVHNDGSTLWYFSQCGNYNLNFLHVQCTLSTSQK